MDAENDLSFADFFDVLYQFAAILDPQGNVIRANKAALKPAGLHEDQIRGRPVWEVAWTGLSKANRQSLKNAVGQAALGDPVRSELVVRRGRNLQQVIDFSLRPIWDGETGVKYILAEAWDETAYKETSDALYRSEARFRTIFEKAGIGILIKGVDGRILDSNPAFQSMLGYDPLELLQMKYIDITHGDDRAVSRKLFNELVKGRRESYSMEKRYLHKDGRPVWASITTSMVRGPDHEAQYVIASVENITPRKLVEEELFELQRTLNRGREMERLRLAQELHDGPLQEIAGISFRFKELESALPDREDRKQLRAVRDSLQQVSRSIRSLCSELRPPSLISFSLEKTIRSHAQEFQTAHPEIHLNLALADDDQALSELTRIALYRIYQEAMRNIQRHAQASQVWIRFQLDEEQVVLEVQDDGTGFVLPDRWVTLANQGHLGLVGAMERARDAGGRLKVTSSKKHGTLLRAVLPLEGNTLSIHVSNQENRP